MWRSRPQMTRHSSAIKYVNEAVTVYVEKVYSPLPGGMYFTEKNTDKLETK